MGPPDVRLSWPLSVLRSWVLSIIGTKLAVIPVLPDARYLRVNGGECIVRDARLLEGTGA